MSWRCPARRLPLGGAGCAGPRPGAPPLRTLTSPAAGERLVKTKKMLCVLGTDAKRIIPHQDVTHMLNVNEARRLQTAIQNHATPQRSQLVPPHLSAVFHHARLPQRLRRERAPSPRG
jgi:hypothetical protein